MSATVELAPTSTILHPPFGPNDATPHRGPYVLRVLVEYLGKGQYRATDGTPLSPTFGRELVARTTTPLFDAARAFMALGHDPEALVQMARKGTPERVDMSGRLGALARLTVHEPANGSPRIVRWRPSPFVSTSKTAETTESAQ